MSWYSLELSGDGSSPGVAGISPVFARHLLLGMSMQERDNLLQVNSDREGNRDGSIADILC